MNYGVEGRRGVLTQVSAVLSDELISPIGSATVYTLCRNPDLAVTVAGVPLNVHYGAASAALAIPLNIKGLVPTPSAQMLQPTDWVVLWCDEQMLLDLADDIKAELEPNVR